LKSLEEKISVENFDNLLYLSRLYHKTKQYDSALALLQHLKPISTTIPNAIEVLLLMSNTIKDQGKLVESKEVIQEAVELIDQ
jgi:hypothetical protein